MADSPIRVYGLGSKGVNLVKSPMEMDDDELTQAQNAEPYNDRGRFGLRKRLGLQRVVPTGDVVPSSAGGGILGTIVIDDPAGWAPPVAGEQTVIVDGYISTDGGTTWTAYTPDDGAIGATPNTLYDLASGYDANTSPQFPPIWLDGLYYMGGTESGQLIVAFVGNAALGQKPNQLYSKEVTRFSGTNVANDTVILPGLYREYALETFDLGTASWLVVQVMGGNGVNTRLHLHNPKLGVTYSLPEFGDTEVVTGSYSVGGWLFVTKGLSLYGIDLNTRDGSETWQTLATVSDTGIAALTGLAALSSDPYTLLAGTRTTGANPVRVYGFVLTPVTPGTTPTATASTAASVNQSSGPSYIYGPFPALSSDQRLSMVYFGNAPIFTNLQGSAGNAESMVGTSWRILTYSADQLFHNGADTSSDNLINTVWEGSSSRRPGPISNSGGRLQMMYTRYTLSGSFLGESRRVAPVVSWGTGTINGGTALVDAFWTFPPVMLF